MTTNIWPTKLRSITNIHLDEKNPRLGREVTGSAPREIIQYLFEHDKALEIAQSIATRGYFSNEPLLAINEKNKLIVVEGNRRLAALKALREPGLLEGSLQRKLERLARKIDDPKSISNIPVTLAPSRKATDKLVAGRHIGNPVLAWQAENRASFILEKLEEGYTNDELRDQLGFTLSDIQSARQTRAIADMARSLDLPDEVMAKLDKPRTNLFTTLERVFDSSVGREFLKIERDSEHGIKGVTTRSQFLKGFKRLVSDIALGKESSRTLNTNENIREYFEKLDKEYLPEKKQGTFVPFDITKGKSSSYQKRSHVNDKEKGKKKTRSISATVVPKDFKVRYGNERLCDLRNELAKIKREDLPNAGAVLLRVFFELSVLHYLERIGELDDIIKKIEEKDGRRLPHHAPNLKQLIPTIIRIAKDNLSRSEAQKVEKAVKYDASAPFTISDLHGFVHNSDLPSARDIQQFWNRTEPLFRLMLENDIEN